MEKSVSIISGLDFVLDPVPDDTNKRKGKIPKSFKEKVKIIAMNITVEPIFFCYILPTMMAHLATQNLILEKACRVNLQMDASICDALTLRNISGYDKTEERKVHSLVTEFNSWKNVLRSVLPIVMMLFLGSYSDRRKKRKICIQLPLIGDVFISIGFILCTYFFYQLPMEWTALVEIIPFAIFGSWFTFGMGTYSYITASSDDQTRTIRIGFANMMEKVCFTIGSSISGIFLKMLGFYGIFGLSMALYVIGLFYTIFWLKEISIKSEEENVTPIQKNNNGIKGFLTDFFNISHLLDTFRIGFKTGARNRKKRIIWIMILVTTIIGPHMGESSVSYLYTRFKFNWNEVDYSIFHTYIVVLHMIGTSLSLMVLTTILKVDDTFLGFVSVFSKILASAIYAFAPSPIYFYLAGAVEMFNGTSFIAMRSIISKLVPKEEIGSINSLFGACESLVPFLYVPLYNLTYKATLSWFSGFFYILGGILSIPSVLIFYWLYIEHKRDAKSELKHIELSQEEKPLKS